MASQRMAAVDAAWLHMDRPVNELVVNAVLWFDEPLDEDIVREAIEKRFVAHHPRFAQRVQDTGTAAWWVDEPDFDPMTHVSRDRLAEPGDLTQLSRHVTRIASTPLPRNRPLWRIHLLDGYSGGTALVARIHHCIADGVALFRVLLSLSDEAQVGRLDPPVSESPEADRSALRRLGDGAIGVGKVSRALLELVALPPDRHTGLRTPLCGAKTLRWSEPLPLDAVKAAARAAGGTVNDLVLAALSGALRRRLQDIGGAVHDVRAVLPVNLRPLDRTEIELGNRFGLVFLRLPVSTANGSHRIAVIRRRTAALKKSATAVVALHILRLAGGMHTRIIRILIDLFSAKGSVVVTNVPGPAEALHLGGRRMAGVVAWPPQSGSIGIGVSLISYAGNVVLGVMADDRVGLEPSRLLADLRAELQALGVRLEA